MTHVTVLTGFMGDGAGPVGRDDGRRAQPGPPSCGFGLGIAATIRPLDAVAFALPAGLLVSAARVRRPARWLDALASGARGGTACRGADVGQLPHYRRCPALRLRCDVGTLADLGFRPRRGAMLHTPVRGLELTNLYLLRLQNYLFETPFPRCCPPWPCSGWSDHDRADRFFLVRGAPAVLLYAGYWHDGFYPRPAVHVRAPAGAGALDRARLHDSRSPTTGEARDLGVALVDRCADGRGDAGADPRAGNISRA